jgi:BirA family biotin operon repressor/biotin-[acetyl-CoA-carboxylase] ligase
MYSFRILHKKLTVSTMKDARDALAEGYGHGTVCIADTQTGGRGRISGRRWEDEGKGSLLFTLILSKESVDISYPLTQLLALALCIRLEEGFGLTPGIKWPNDVFVNGGKIAGILVETDGDYYLAGMGVNILQTSFSGHFRHPAVSLAQVLSSMEQTPAVSLSPSRELMPLLEVIRKLLSGNPGIREIENRLIGLIRPVSLSIGDPARREILQGFIAGLQDDGALLVRSEDKVLTAVYSGEIEALESR